MNIGKSLKKIKCGKIKENVDLSIYLTYKLKCTCKYLVIPNDIDDLLRLMNFIKSNNIKYKILGGGSNLIFKNDFYDGILIKLDKFDGLVIDGTKIKVGSGYSTMKLALKTCHLGLTGFEFATGIPGSIGGAIFNNSGAYKSDMGYIVESVTVLTPDLKIKTLYNKNLEYHYRTSFFKNNPGGICFLPRNLNRRPVTRLSLNGMTVGYYFKKDFLVLWVGKNAFSPFSCLASHFPVLYIGLQNVLVYVGSSLRRQIVRLLFPFVHPY